MPLIHQVVVAQLAAARQGTAPTKTRGEVRGGGQEAVPPEGHRPGPPGFDPRAAVHRRRRRPRTAPRDYIQRTPKKMKAAALRGALSDRARHGRVHVVEAIVDARQGAVDQGRRRGASAQWSSAAHVLVVAERGDSVTWKSLRNVRAGAPHRPGPAQHLRRAGQRRRGLHRRRAGGFLAGPPKGKGAKAVGSVLRARRPRLAPTTG